jgi:hypothetical protein
MRLRRNGFECYAITDSAGASEDAAMESVDGWRGSWVIFPRERMPIYLPTQLMAR